MFPWLLLLLPITMVLSQQQPDFIYTGFTGGGGGANSNISLNGVSEIQPDGILRLTNETLRLIGRAFYPTPLLFKNTTDGSAFSFSTAFAFSVVPEYPKLGGHGLAFVLATSMSLPGALPSQYLGLLNSTDNGNATNHVFAVEFDTVQDFEFGDINDNHVGIDINSMTSNQSQPVAYFADDSTKRDLNLKTGDTLQAWIDYDGVSKVLNVTIAPFSTKPTIPIISFPVDLSPILHDRMFVGFSASTGLLASSHYLFAWSFKMNGVARSLDLSSLPSLPKPPKKNTTFVIAISISSALFVIAAISAAAYLFYKIKNADLIEPWELECGPQRFSYKELKRATKGFRDRELLGFGGFGKVYKGTFRGSKTEVAVKRVSHESKQGIREFVAEIASIGRLRHRNLVQLQGWCRRRADLILVYDYMSNGSLDKYLFSDPKSQHPPPKPPLSWRQRFHVLKGVASALLYLHEEWEHVVIHRDVKASNVLLDGDLNGRLGDFGLAKLYEHGANNPSTTRVVGTLGYLAPELTRTGKATTSSDVFAFGAVVLEVVCGRRPIEPKALPEELVLVDWVWDLWAAGRWEEVVDPRLKAEYDREEVEVALKVGLMCSHPAAMARPRMRDVARYLDGGDVPEVKSPPEEYEGKSLVGFDDDYVHSYPSSSSFELKVKWLLKPSEIPEISEVPNFSENARSFLENIICDFKFSDALEVKKIEKVTNHDIKAVEYFLKQKCKSCPEIAEVLEFFHFACTSEDINNLAHALSLKDAMNTVIFPTMIELSDTICKMAKENASIPMLSRTHGQPASPTTLGKEMANFAVRLSDQGKKFPQINILGKFAGTVGNYNAHKVAYPTINWPSIAADFVRSLGVEFNPYVTQIEPHDYISELFNRVVHVNNILVDFDRDIWSYISLGYFKQITKAGEIGSSTMPHKVNPIDFENSEGNLCLANAILSALSMKLPISRMQRDLTDSTVLRNLGVGLGYSLLAYKSTLQGIKKLQVNEYRLRED